jgi:flagellar biogenesis protein FliO
MSRLLTLILLATAAAPSALAQATVDPAADLRSILLSLAVVVGLIVGAAFVLKRTPLGQAARGSGPLKVVASLALGSKERLLLVDVHGVEMLVAIGPSGTAIAPADGSGASGKLPRTPHHGDEAESVFNLGDAR